MLRVLFTILILILAIGGSALTAMAAGFSPPVSQSLEGSIEKFLRLETSGVESLEKLGPLQDLPGTWVGKGWNLIAFPINRDGREQFEVEIHPYLETLTFTPIGASVPNKGFPQETFAEGVLYEQRVTDDQTGQPLHVERGMWLLLDDNDATSDDHEELTIARLSTVPHGDTVLALGTYRESQSAPFIGDLDTLPIFADPSQVGPGYLSQYTEPDLPAEADFDTHNANLPLQTRLKQQASQGQIVSRTTVLDVSTQRGTGAVVNIPFIQEKANVSSLNSTFWIEVITDVDTGKDFLQLQYSQQTHIDFIPDFTSSADPQPLIIWPHADVSTLVKQ